MFGRGDSGRGNLATPEGRSGLAAPARLLAALVATALISGGAGAATKAVTPAKAKPRITFDVPVASFTPPADIGRFSFTAAGNAAASARQQTQDRAFRFTPSGQTDNRKALSLGLSTRVVTAAADKTRVAAPIEATAALPTAYGVEASVGYKGFGFNTGYRHVEPGPGALLASSSDAVDVGLSYGGRNWKTRLMGTAEQRVSDLGSALLVPLERRYSVELGGAYSVAPRLSVSGGVRYKLAPNTATPLDNDRPDQSVYLGTNIAF